MIHPPLTKETDIAERVIDWLADQGWDVYQEVQIFSNSNVADIVAVRESLTWVIEVKARLTINLLAQAQRWTHHANHVSIAVPRARARNVCYIRRILGLDGIGWISVGDKVNEIVHPRLNRRPSRHLRNRLSQEHKCFAKAGNADGRYFTPYQATCREIVRFVNQYPGATLKQVVESIPHHYASPTSARSALSKWARMDVIKGIRSERDGKLLRFFPVNEK